MKKTLFEHIDYFLADKLARLREATGMSREQLASLTGIAARDVYRFERAHAAMGAQDIAIFAKNLGVRPNDFYAGFEPTSEDASLLKPIGQAQPNQIILQLVQNFLAISEAEIRHSLGATARQAARHY